MYSSAFVFFSSTLSDALLKSLASSPAKPHIQCLKEVNFDYLAIEPRVFHFDSPKSFYQLFSPESPGLMAECAEIASRLATLCVSMNEYPIIRYEANERDVCKLIAAALQARIDDLIRKGVYQPNMQCRARLLICGRTVDVISPLVTEFTYQAMAYHFLTFKNGVFKFKYGATEKEVVLDDRDQLWPLLRHMHVADAIKWIIENFNAFLAANKATQMAKSGAKNISTLKEMREAMQAMPQYFELLSKYALHLAVAGDCMNAFNKRQMLRIAGLEQDLATGCDAQGQEAKNIMSTLPPILSDPNIDIEDKKRLIMLFIISQEGMKEVDRKRMMDYASLTPRDQAAISNLYFLGVTLTKAATRGRKKKEKKRAPVAADDVPYELSRFIPRLKQIMRDLISAQLSAETFPFIKEAPTSSSASLISADKSGLKSSTAHPKWADAKNKAPASASNVLQNEEFLSTASKYPRYIVFVAGGMTYSEVRTAYEVSKRDNRHCYIGSTHIITPKTFVESLEELKKL
jgi:hypothetical protein